MWAPMRTTQMRKCGQRLVILLRLPRFGVAGLYIGSILMASKEQIIEALKTVEDPELYLDIWFLGLIYSIEPKEEGGVDIEMTFTSPMCPAGPQLIEEVKNKVGALEGASPVNVKIVFSPPWKPSDDVKAMLGLI